MSTVATGRRLALALVAIFLVIAAFGIRLVDLQLVRADELVEESESTKTVDEVIPGVRGRIVDTNGSVLADSVERYDIKASPLRAAPVTRVDDEGNETEYSVMELIQQVAAILDADEGELWALMTENPESDFVYLARGVRLEEFNAIRELGIWWIGNDPVPARTYPNGSVAGNLVGFVNADGPLAGAEWSYDSCLDASNGLSSYRRSSGGTRLPGSTVVETEAVDGADVRLTIDTDLQWFAQQTAATFGAEVGAESVNIMVVRVSDGHIKAAADWPVVDPNDRNTVAPEFFGARAFSYLYEPGSTIKTLSTAVLLDRGLIDVSTGIMVPGRYTEGLPAGYQITDAWIHGDVPMTATGVLANSSNIGTVMLGERMSAADRLEYFRAFGFGDRTAVEFSGEEYGVFQTDTVTERTMQFGQGFSVTSAQVASAYQAIGNGGVRMPLTLVEGCAWPDGEVTHQPDGEGVRVVSEYAAHTTVAMLEQVVTQTYNSAQLSIPGYRVAAKTGTAEVAGPNGYGDDRVTSIAGLIPADDPEFAIVVTVVKPDTMRSSAAVAPTFTAIAKQVIKAFRITPSSEPAPQLALDW